MGTSVLGGFVDSVVQKLENCRAGLPGGLEAGAVEKYVRELYDAERPRLHEAVQMLAPILDEDQLTKEETELDELFQRVLVPAYARAACDMTLRERNDFYLTKKGLHGLERVGWLAGGVAAGALFVWAPFIPIYAKEAIIPFAIGGLFFPELRRFFAYRRYARELNKLVGNVESEARRLQSHYLDSPVVAERLEAPATTDDRPRLPSGQKQGH